jgi:endonuclease/exonuclease/phosphatase family metal-dependent hydrolase
MQTPDRFLDVMTFNVRYAEPADGSNVWELRRDLAAKVVQDYSPDIVGTQEPLLQQLQYLQERLPDHKWFGLSRYGNKEEKFAAIFYKPAKLRLVEHGQFWLSDRPDEVGSNTWDLNKPRIVTWGRFEHRATGSRVLHANVHMPWRDQEEEARMKCARLLSARARELSDGNPVILTGDFNHPAGKQMHSIFLEHFDDAWLQAQDRKGPEGTFHGFSGTPLSDNRIDWILYRGLRSSAFAEAVTQHEGQRFPSDHFPVFARLELQD